MAHSTACPTCSTASSTPCATSSPHCRRSSSRSAAAPTRRSSPPSPTARSAERRVHAVTAVSPSLAGAEHEDCRALAGEWGLRWTAVATDEMARAAYRVERSRPLLPLQGRADGRARADRRCRGRARSCSGSTSTTSVTTVPGSAPQREAGAAFPLVTAGLAKADVRAASRRARPAHVGQAGRGLPGEPGAVRNGGVGGGAVTSRAGRGGAARARLPAGAGAPLRRHGAASRSSCPSSTALLECGPKSSPGSAPPATATSPSTSRASGPAT